MQTSLPKSRDFHIPLGKIRTMVPEIIRCDYAERDNGYEDELNLHHYHQMDIILEGEFTLTFQDEKEQTGYAGDVLVIPPLITHQTRCAKPYRFCSFKFYLTPQFWQYFGNTVQRFHISQKLLEYVNEIGSNTFKVTPHTGEHAAAIVSLCLIEFMNQHAVPVSNRDSFDDFRNELWPLLEQLQLSPSIKWSITDMANKIGMSPDHFSRCFTRVLGQTPQQYIKETVMRNAAANLVESPSMPVKKVAKLAGYADVHSFSHAFKRIFKTSPTAYKRQQNEEID